MKRLLLSLLFACGSFLLWAQASPIKITYEHEPNNQLTFYAENFTFVPYTVSLNFTRLSNTATLMEGDTYQGLVERGKKRLVTLRPMNPDTGIGFSYTARYEKGNIQAKADTNFVYLFPLQEGKQVRMNRMNSLHALVGKTEKSHLTGIAFHTTEGDTIVAARRGQVTQVVDHSASTEENRSFDANENYVEVYHHADGTFAIYKLFKNGGIFVEPGDEVIPGQPLGIVGGSNYQGGSHLRFMVSSPILEPRSFLPSFYLSSGQSGKPDFREVYISEHPVDIVVKELSKKEKKRVLLKKEK